MSETEGRPEKEIEIIWQEPLSFLGQSSRSTSWWSNYEKSLIKDKFSELARAVIFTDSRYIFNYGVSGSRGAQNLSVEENRVRSGIVMGAVQSGKTASMLGVTALCLDYEVDAVVILAGTRVSLWKQTFSRLVDQLDGAKDFTVIERAKRRVLVPNPDLVLDDSNHVSLSRLYHVPSAQLEHQLRNRSPLIIVAMKNVDHLRALSSFISESLVPIIDSLERPFKMAVLDDEADDGSILDARVEASRDSTDANLKQIPRAIEDLWSTRYGRNETKSRNLQVTYVGYTATPQANFLQSHINPLAPRDFAISLRTPFLNGELSPRSSTYRENRGLAYLYTGGATFYGELRDTLCPQISGNDDLDLLEALRSHFVGAAIRRWQAYGEGSTPGSFGAVYETEETAMQAGGKPHTMLFHPSPAISDHFEAAAKILQVLCGLSAEESKKRIEQGSREIDGALLANKLFASENEWEKWIGSFQESWRAVIENFELPNAKKAPRHADWPEIREIILSEIVPNTRIRIVNSDPRADDRPNFGPLKNSDGTWSAPPDLNSIFVSGNVMSRGLTLDGLSTTLFLRKSDNPFADTQMQMQRWFGFRGSHIEFCRVFMSREQLNLFTRYHDADEALRKTVITAMNEVPDCAPDPFVLQGDDYSATGKLTNVENAPLSPGPSPFIRTINSESENDPNLALVAEIFSTSTSQDVVTAGTLRGRILAEPILMVEVANILDRLRYETHNPSVDSWEGRRWRDLETKIDLSGDDEIYPLFRPPIKSFGPLDNALRGGPYAIAAYLRLWTACLTRRSPGLVPTDNPALPWSMVSLDEKQKQAPKFYVGIRYGRGESISDIFGSPLPFSVKTMEREVLGDQLVGGWGTRNPGTSNDAYMGDQWFDYHFHMKHRPGEAFKSESRMPGSPGLLLFYLVDRPGKKSPGVSLGLVIPAGGPDQFAARPSHIER